MPPVPNRDAYRAWVLQFTERGFHAPVQHTSSPIVWSEEATSDSDDEDDEEDMKTDHNEGKEGKEGSDGDEKDAVERIHIKKRNRTFLGGCDATLAWLKDQVAPRPVAANVATAAELAIDSEVGWCRDRGGKRGGNEQG